MLLISKRFVMIPHAMNINKVRNGLPRHGFVWVIGYGLYRLLFHVQQVIKRFLIRRELRMHYVGDGSIISEGLSLEEARTAWDAYDWSMRGEEWTNDVTKYKNISPTVWRRSLVQKVMNPYLTRKQVILEIGSGAGRWSSLLVRRASKLILVEVSKKAMQLCRARFRRRRNVVYLLVSDLLLMDVSESSVDFIWSYDVFVHLNPNMIASYLHAMKRVLAPGGVAVIHHAGTYVNDTVRIVGVRSWMTAEFFAALVRRSGLKLVTQDVTISHFPGDVVTVFTKPIESQ